MGIGNGKRWMVGSGIDVDSGLFMLPSGNYRDYMLLFVLRLVLGREDHDLDKRSFFF